MMIRGMKMKREPVGFKNRVWLTLYASVFYTLVLLYVNGDVDVDV